VTKLIYRLMFVCPMPLLIVAFPAAAAVQPNETRLRAADAEELRNVPTGDAAACKS
jgi:hypothetical protein